jgi:hypothetical protein
MPHTSRTRGMGTDPRIAYPADGPPTVTSRCGRSASAGVRTTCAPPSGALAVACARANTWGVAGVRSTAARSVNSGPTVGGASAGGPV